MNESDGEPAGSSAVTRRDPGHGPDDENSRHDGDTPSRGLLDAPTDHSTGPAAAAPPCQGISPRDSLDFVRQLDDYEVLDEIARGGMGVVFRARQKSLKRVVALKVILIGPAATAEEIGLFRAEAESAAQLKHPAIVSVHDFGESAGYHFLSMELIDGESLARRLGRGPLPSRDAATLMRAIAEAVQHAHDHGIIHRDLKPANILLDKQGHPHITDFGIASRASDTRGTGDGMAMAGTPGFMSPEQANGEVVTSVSDVYSLGAVLYAMVTGRAPFLAATPLDTLLQVLESEPAPPRTVNSGVAPDLESIILKSLRKSPRDRFPSARELAEDLGRFLDGEAVHARRGDSLYFASRWLRNNLVLAGVSSIVALLLLSLTTAMAIAYRVEITRRLALERQLAEEQTRAAVAQEQARRANIALLQAQSRMRSPDHSTPSESPAKEP